MGRVHEVSVKGEPEVWKFSGEHTAESSDGVFRLLDPLDQVVCTVPLDRLEWHRSTSPDEIANTKAAGSVPYSPGVQVMEGFKAPSSEVVGQFGHKGVNRSGTRLDWDQTGRCTMGARRCTVVVWEYAVIEARDGSRPVVRFSHSDEVVPAEDGYDTLRYLGDSGWELVSIVDMRYGVASYFKRPRARTKSGGW